MNNFICLICYEETDQYIKLDCNCPFCYQCFMKFLEHQISQITFNNIIVYKCPGCNLQYSEMEIYEYTKMIQQDTQFLDMLDKKYLISQSDVRGCPNHQCNYYGFLPQNKCNKKLICNKCETQWICPELLSTNGKIKAFILNFSNSKETLNYIYEFFMTQKCPKCMSAIYKLGGCSHMTCQYCKFEFCWLCKKPHIGHNYNNCIIHQWIYYGIILNFFFNLIVYFQFHFLILDFCIMLIIMLLKFIVNNLIAGLIVYIIYNLYQSIQQQYNINKKYPNGNAYYETQRDRYILVMIISLIILSIVIGLVYYYTNMQNFKFIYQITFYYSSIYSWLQYLFYEIFYFCLLGGSLIFFVEKVRIFLNDGWFIYVR